jgi:hypothetical protein
MLQINFIIIFALIGLTFFRNGAKMLGLMLTFEFLHLFDN